MTAIPTKPAEYGWPGGDQPGALAFTHRVEGALRDGVVAALGGALGGLCGATLCALTPPQGAVGRFALATPAKRWFVRISARWDEPELEQAITAHLRDRGVKVNHLEIAGVPLEFGGGRCRVDVRELIDGHHFDGSPDELRALAAEIAHCHEALRDFPRAGEVRRNAAARFEQLAEVRDGIRDALSLENWAHFSSDESWGRGRVAWLHRMCEEFQPRFDLFDGAQCLHAQVHRANVIFPSDGSRPVLLDFEESIRTFAPVAWDMAYFIQRFCLHDSPPPELLRARLENCRAPLAGVATMMRQTAWFSMAILVRNWSGQRIVAPVAEYEKFVRLEEQARELEPVFAALG